MIEEGEKKSEKSCEDVTFQGFNSWLKVELMHNVSTNSETATYDMLTALIDHTACEIKHQAALSCNRLSCSYCGIISIIIA